MRMLQHAHSSPGVLLMAIGADVLHLLTVYWIGAETRVGRLIYPATAGERSTVSSSAADDGTPDLTPGSVTPGKQIRPWCCR